MAKQNIVFAANGDVLPLEMPEGGPNGAVAVQLTAGSGGIQLQMTVDEQNWTTVGLTDVNTKAVVTELTANGQIGWADVPGAVGLRLRRSTGAAGSASVNWQVG